MDNSCVEDAQTSRITKCVSAQEARGSEYVSQIAFCVIVITCEQPNGVIARCVSGSHRPAQCDRDRR
jgi:hypothetical protein